MIDLHTELCDRYRGGTIRVGGGRSIGYTAKAYVIMYGGFSSCNYEMRDAAECS